MFRLLRCKTTVEKRKFVSDYLLAANKTKAKSLIVSLNITKINFSAAKSMRYNERKKQYYCPAYVIERIYEFINNEKSSNS